jgi:hypothetical protein
MNIGLKPCPLWAKKLKYYRLKTLSLYGIEYSEFCILTPDLFFYLIPILKKMRQMDS